MHRLHCDNVTHTHKHPAQQQPRVWPRLHMSIKCRALLQTCPALSLAPIASIGSILSHPQLYTLERNYCNVRFVKRAVRLVVQAPIVSGAISFFLPFSVTSFPFFQSLSNSPSGHFPLPRVSRELTNVPSLSLTVHHSMQNAGKKYTPKSLELYVMKFICIYRPVRIRFEQCDGSMCVYFIVRLFWIVPPLLGNENLPNVVQTSVKAYALYQDWPRTWKRKHPGCSWKRLLGRP